MAQLPTIEDVARAASVSRQTVSNVLNSPEIVKADTRSRVEEAIATLGYRVHASARRLRTRQSSTIGIRLDPVSNGISGSVIDRFLHALTEHAATRGMRVTLFTADDVDQEIEEFARLRDGADVDAFVVTATRFGDPRIHWLIEQKVPFVSFGRPWGEAMDSPDHLWVDADGSEGTYQATQHLLWRGLHRIGWLGWPSGSGTGDHRRSGWERAMREAGATQRELDDLTIVTEESVPNARRIIQELFETDHGLDGLVCVSDSLALGAMMAVNAAGQPRFPVIGFDNTPVAQAVGLSSVDQQLDQVAAGTLELLMGATGRRVLPHGSGGDDPSHRLVTPKLVVRRSSHLAPVEDAPTNHNRKEDQ